jgi:hypothetical protein
MKNANSKIKNWFAGLFPGSKPKVEFKEKDASETEQTLVNLNANIQKLIDCKKGLEPHKITLNVFYKGTKLRNVKTMYLKTLREMVKEAEFIEDNEAVELINERINLVRKEL